MKITLDLKPLSVNDCWQGKRFFTKKGKEFRKTCLWLLPKVKTIKGLLKVEVFVQMKTRWLASDVDNFAKPLLDAIVKKGIIEDDRFIVDLRIVKSLGDKDKVDIFIENV